MKWHQIFKACLMLGISICISLQVIANDLPTNEKILSFHSDIYVHPQSEILVEEQIKVVALGEQIKRGLMRWLPLVYRDRHNTSYRVDYDITEIKCNGIKTPFHEKYQGDMKVIYIGDKDTYLKPGVYDYTISYITRKQVRYFDDYDELYWNVTGNAWPFQIDQASVSLYLPDNAKINQARAYTGLWGYAGNDYVEERLNDTTIQFKTTSRLAKHSGLTIAVGWPKGIVHQPSQFEEASFFLESNPSLKWGLFCFALILSYYGLVFLKVGRDPIAGVIVPQYDPPKGLSPAAMRYIYHMGYDDIAATVAIISLATKGFISIDQNKDDSYSIRKNTNTTSENILSPGEKVLLNTLVPKTGEIELSNDNHAVISKSFKSFKKKLDKEYMAAHFKNNHVYMIPALIVSVIACLVLSGYSKKGIESLFLMLWIGLWTIGSVGLITAFWTNLMTLIRERKFSYLKKTMGSLLIVIPFIAVLCVVMAELIATFNEIVTALLFSIFIVNGLFLYLLRRPTDEGRRVMDQIEGFKLFLEKTEKYAIDKKAPQVTSKIFERYLPYAIALGVETAWSAYFTHVLASSKIESHKNYQPSWYSGTNWSSVGSRGFGAAIATGISTAAMASSIRSSGSGGGGFSGGGGGGGGGGGW